MLKVRILADSITSFGQRRTTVEFTYQRWLHDEFMTYRDNMSRNTSSSRALPVRAVIEQTLADPAPPVHWGLHQRGMQADRELSRAEALKGFKLWLKNRDAAAAVATEMIDLGLHKQVANRILMPNMWITAIFTSTSWDNFFAQRVHRDADPNIAKIASMFLLQYMESKPKLLHEGEWHLPLVTPDDRRLVVLLGDNFASTVRIPGFTPEEHNLAVICTAKCAAVSYLRQDDVRTVVGWATVHDKMATASPGHWSPFEHAARVNGLVAKRDFSPGFDMYRKFFPGEHGFFAYSPGDLALARELAARELLTVEDLNEES